MITVLRGQVAVSLFPFLSILASAIGTMALVIAGMSSILLSQADQVVDPSPFGTTLRPRYVECRADGLLLHPERRSVSFDNIGSDDNAWRALLEELQPLRHREYVIFLVRPNGRETFERARSDIELRPTIRFGFEPVYSAGAIDVREKKEEPR